MAKHSESLPPPSSQGASNAPLPPPQYELLLGGGGRGRKGKRYAVAPEFAAAVAAEVVANMDAPPPAPPQLVAARAGVGTSDGRFGDDGVQLIEAVRAEENEDVLVPAAPRRRMPIDESRIFPGGIDESLNYGNECYEEAVADEAPVTGRARTPRVAKAPKAPKAPLPVPSSAPARLGKPAAKKHWWDYEISAKKIKPVELMNFTRQASSFIKAGIPIIDAFDTIAADTKDKTFAAVLADTAERLRGGMGLGEALAAQAVAFPPYFVSMVRSAELTGRLDEVLDQLADYMQRDLDTKRQIKSALTYPSVVMLTGVGTVVTLTVYVLPKFKDFFAQLDAKLPLTTRMLLGFSDFLSAWGLIMLGLFVAAFVGLFAWMKTETGKLKRDSFFLRVPVIGTLVQYVAVERFCRGLSALVSAGVPLPDAMRVASETTGNRKFMGRLTTVRERLMKGEGLAQPVADTGLFPPAASQMIRVGEATGTLDTQLDSASDFYKREVSYRLKKFTDMFEPLMIIGMGFMVGFVALALVQAMYGVFGQVK